MIRFSANLSMLFTEADFTARFGLAAAAGFRGVEYLFPYAWPAEELREQLEKHSLVQVLHNMPAGDWDAGERGIACIPGREGEYQDGVGLAIKYAKTLGCTQLNSLIGKTPQAPADKIHSTLIANLQFAADELAKENITLLIEPLNTTDIPGFHLHRTNEAIALMEEIGKLNLKLQYDVYHMQIMEGNLTAAIRKYMNRIGHIQIADVPGRNEPGTGEINYPNLFRFIEQAGYAGWIGCEYKPAASTEAGLGWIKQYLGGRE